MAKKLIAYGAIPEGVEKSLADPNRAAIIRESLGGKLFRTLQIPPGNRDLGNQVTLRKQLNCLRTYFPIASQCKNFHDFPPYVPDASIFESS